MGHSELIGEDILQVIRGSQASPAQVSDVVGTSGYGADLPQSSSVPSR